MNRLSERSGVRVRRGGTLLGGMGLLLGAGAAVLTPSSTGCLFPDDPTPDECENIVDGRSGETSGEGSETGGDGGDLDAGAYISCSGDVCDVDEALGLFECA